ncbi:MAG: AAA family ATPase [Anaerolineae bacterium]|nr:AAA family ATPase [Anaerolineae bacterium]
METLQLPRYRLIEETGRGGMGVIYRAHDRLTGNTVALKRVTTPLERLDFHSRSASSSADFQVALAREFRILASLRNPNIIKVLDYGWANNGEPYYTMDWLFPAQTILEAPFTPTDLLAQLLEALAYLHRREVIHRDLKPDNILVVNGVVKVLDFGLALIHGQDDDENMAGTLEYLPPEVLQGEPASTAGDLYAVGVIAYRLLTGKHPFEGTERENLLNRVLLGDPNLSLINGHALYPLIAKLLSRNPKERGTAREAVMMIGGDVALTTGRESFLQAARFVGREGELDHLSTILDRILNGQHGAAVLIGGESGVGKSRLIDELRAEALVAGARVARGGATRESRRAFEMWREPLALLCLERDLSPLDAGVLRSIIPDLAQVIDTPIADPPPLDPLANRSRLIDTITRLFVGDAKPTLIILEDLHWAHDSLDLLKALIHLTHTQPLMVVGNYRDEERPDLPNLLTGAEVIKLARLSREDIAQLSASMIGQTGKNDAVVNLLERESEGNPFFIVEVMRHLADAIGNLDAIGASTVPESLFAGGVRRVLENRLARVAPVVRPILQMAALAGRIIDPVLLATVFKQDLATIEAHLTVAADVAVLEGYEGGWRFAHDKMRESLLENLDEAANRAYSHQLAEAIELLYPDSPEYYATLAQHWANAQQPRKESVYAMKAAERALRTGANQRALTYLERALSLHENGSVVLDNLQYAGLQLQMGQTYLALGMLDKSSEHATRALISADIQDNPTLGGALRQTLRQIRYRFINPKPNLVDATRYRIASQACEVLAQNGFYINDKIGAIYHILLGHNLAERGGESCRPQLLRHTASMLLVMGVIPLHRLAQYYGKRAHRLIQSVDDPAVTTWLHMIEGVYLLGRGQWHNGLTTLQTGMDLAVKSGHVRRQEEIYVMLRHAYHFRGDADDAHHAALQTLMMTERSNTVQGIASAYSALIGGAIRQNAWDEAARYGESALIFYEQSADRGGVMRLNAMMAWVYHNLNQPDKAADFAQIALEMIQDLTSTAFYLVEGYQLLLMYFLSLYEEIPLPEFGDVIDLILKKFKKFSKPFDMAEPILLILIGWRAFLHHDRQATFVALQKAMTTAEKLNMRYEQDFAIQLSQRLLGVIPPYLNR